MSQTQDAKHPNAFRMRRNRVKTASTQRTACKVPTAIVALCILAACVLVMVGAGYVVLRDLGKHLDEAWEPQTVVARYPEYLAHLHQCELAAHFPPAAPAGTLAVYYNPGAFQAPTVLHLLIQSDQAGVEEAVKKAKARIEEANAAGREIDESNRPDSYLKCLEGEDKKFGQDLPDAFEVYLHRSESSAENWNHGIQEGVAIDPKTNRILYFSDGW